MLLDGDWGPYITHARRAVPLYLYIQTTPYTQYTPYTQWDDKSLNHSSSQHSKTFSLVETERNPDASFRPLLAAAHLFDISLRRFFDAEAVMWAVGATALVSLALTLFAMQTKVRTRHAL